ncbi:hypothetical protein V6N13_102120 [Hibiscus sabdariffa]|uniref:Uncharacterized protein n=1 Tax=Hibiscus sabdariffa TaxID=183260 RepID=A0ABR2D328_9ROSI
MYYYVVATDYGLALYDRGTHSLPREIFEGYSRCIAGNYGNIVESNKLASFGRGELIGAVLYDEPPAELWAVCANDGLYLCAKDGK